MMCACVYVVSIVSIHPSISRHFLVTHTVDDRCTAARGDKLCFAFRTFLCVRACPIRLDSEYTAKEHRTNDFAFENQITHMITRCTEHTKSRMISCGIVSMCLLLLSSSSLVASEKEADAIATLPLFGKPDRPQFSGFLNGDANGTFLHYWFAEGPSKDAPVVLWFVLFRCRSLARSLSPFSRCSVRFESRAG